MLEHGVRVLQLHTSAQIRAALVMVGADSALTEKAARAEFRVVKITGAALPLARYLYQELEMESGQAVTASRLDHSGIGTTDVLLCATRYQLDHLLVRLRLQANEELQYLATQIERALNDFISPPPPLDLGGARFDWSRPYVMGILNISPDAFDDADAAPAADRAASWTERAVARAETLIAAGADLLELDNEPTRPYATPTDAETELARSVAVIHALRARGVPLAVNTAKAHVAAAALDAGASLVNDATGLRGDADMARVIAARGAAVVITHADKLAARDFLSALLDHLRAQMNSALNAGVDAARIIIDPGLGLGKTTAQNLTLVNRFGELRVLGCPLLLAPSRQEFSRAVTDAAADEHQAETAAALAIGLARGAHIARGYNVTLMARVAKMTDALLNS
ncbi:MAG: dihydropteroate synthase [Chloroflexota bacterium]|nr:MAG: dihydropteroate synthase [Chloroflexota bacterium]